MNVNFDRYNPLLNVDSYKPGHSFQYPPNTQNVFGYVESRGGVFPVCVFYGLQAYIKKYLTVRITKDMVDEAEELFAEHGVPFYRPMWDVVVKDYDGKLPIIIKAAKEGSVIPVSNAMVTVEVLDERCFGLYSYIETSLLRAVWYGTTVATTSWSIKQLIKSYMEETADREAMAGLDFMLHDFGARGVSSLESAGIGGSAHLVNFMGTDNISGIVFAKKYYGAKGMPAFSVPAAEHSSITTWGKNGEADSYRNMFEQFSGKYPFISVVSDSYDIYNAVQNIWGEELKQMVVDSGSTLVVRPDSGHPSKVVLRVLQLLDEKFGHTVNSKGYKVLKNVKVIQGDGIEESSISEILYVATQNGYSAQNLVFGMGGALLQHPNRDTQKFAMKASAALIDGKWVDVFKDPVTDSVKKSKKGRMTLYRKRTTNEFFTGVLAHGADRVYELELETVFNCGDVVRDETFQEIKDRNKLTTKWYQKNNPYDRPIVHEDVISGVDGGTWA